MGKDYRNYNHKTALEELKLETLEKRRTDLCLKFAKGCLKNEKSKDLFQKNKTYHNMKKRKKERFQVKKIKTERYKKTAVPYMVNLLNEDMNDK